MFRYCSDVEFKIKICNLYTKRFLKKYFQVFLKIISVVYFIIHTLHVILITHFYIFFRKILFRN